MIGISRINISGDYFSLTFTNAQAPYNTNLLKFVEQVHGWSEAEM